MSIGLTGGVAVAAPELPAALAFPLETLPASTTTAAVDPDLGGADVADGADPEASAPAAGVEGTSVPAAPPEVNDAPDPVAEAVERDPDTDVDVAASAEAEAEAVEPEAAVEADPVLAHDAAAVPPPVAGDPAAAAHWDDTAMPEAEADAVGSPFP